MKNKHKIDTSLVDFNFDLKTKRRGIKVDVNAKRKALEYIEKYGHLVYTRLKIKASKHDVFKDFVISYIDIGLVINDKECQDIWRALNENYTMEDVVNQMIKRYNSTTKHKALMYARCFAVLCEVIKSRFDESEWIN